MISDIKTNSIITLSFDDGRKDTYYVFKNILKERNIPATVNIPSGYIEIGFSDPMEIGHNGLMSKADLDDIANDPLFEIAGHGYYHKNEDDDVKKGILKLKEWYPNIECYGFASPHSYMKDAEVIGKKEFYNSLGIQYVRLGRSFWNTNYYRRGLSKIASLSGSTKAYNMCYKDSLNSMDSFVIHAIPIIKTTTLEQVKTIVEYAIKKKRWCVLEIHGIDKKDSKEYEELFCWDIDDFIALCDYLVTVQSKGLITIKNAIDIVNKN